MSQTTVTILGADFLEITPDPTASNSKTIIPRVHVASIMPLKFQQKPSSPEDGVWAYRYDTITKVRFNLVDKKYVDLELQEISNHPDWSTGTLNALNNAVLDINTWLGGGPLSPGYLIAQNSGSPVVSLTGLDYTEFEGPSADSTLFSIQGITLLPAASDITVTPSANIEVWDGSAWQSSPFLVPYTLGVISTVEIYKVRLKSGLTQGLKNETVTLSGGGMPNYTINVSGTVNYSNSFVFTVKTDNAGTSASDAFTLPLYAGQTYNCTIYWGDGTSTLQTTTVSPTHTYPSAGTYQIRISGTFPGIRFNNAGDRQKLLSINNWGTTAWKIMESAFYGCINMVGTYTDVPDTSTCQRFDAAFRTCTLFNSPVNFDTSSAKNMSNMFTSATAFNQSVSSFNTSQVTTFYQMFYLCPNFNQDVNFDTTVCLEFQFMFSGCTNFNGNIGLVGASVTNAAYMFQSCSNFNKSISTLTLGPACLDTRSMFANCLKFNQPITSLDTSGATNMSGMFSGCALFNQSLDSLDTSQNTTFNSFLFGCSVFNSSVNIDTSSATSFASMFQSCTVFNQSVASFDTSSVNTMASMFLNCSNFNQSVANFDTSSVTNMSSMFSGCPKFNQSVSNFDTSIATTVANMFNNCSDFNQSTSTFDLGACLTIQNMFSGCGKFNSAIPSNISVANNTSGVFANCAVFNQSVASITTTASTTMSSMFFNCFAFNQSLSHLNTSNVLTMSQMFQSATIFNQDISGWDTSSATNMTSMFSGAVAFNQNIGGWDVSSVQNFSSMFSSATAFNQNLGAWDVSAATNLTLFMNTKTPATFSTTNLDAIYNGWSLLTLNPNLNISFGTAKYTAGGSAGRAVLTGTYGWTVTDGGI